MSAINTTCPKCGVVYLAGVVGRTPWPAHVCNATPTKDGHRRWVDVHGDDITVGIQANPQAWHDPDDGETLVSVPVVYASGDAYLTAAQAREVADELNICADRLEDGAA